MKIAINFENDSDCINFYNMFDLDIIKQKNAYVIVENITADHMVLIFNIVNLFNVKSINFIKKGKF